MKSHPALAHTCFALLAASGAGALQAQAPASSSLAGQWQFETVIGTNSNNGVVTDEIGQGILTMTPTGKELTGTISWLDEHGKVISARQVKGRVGAAGAVFTHAGKRVTSGRNGRDIAVDVIIRWTLQAKGDQLVGERLVETDEDEPKAVTGTRVGTRNMWPLAALLPAKTNPPAGEAATQAARAPSTPAERARVTQMALDGERAPRPVQQRDGAWLNAWVEAIPDLFIEYGTVFAWLKGVANADIRDALTFQYTASAMAFQIQHPASTRMQADIDAAAMESVLRAYAVLLREDPTQASASLDRALSARNKGQLTSFLGGLSGRDPLPAISAGTARSEASDPTVRRMLALGQEEPRAMEWLDILSNRFGGRMTGSDAYTHAAAWTHMQLRRWGLQAELEEAGQVSLGFNRGPWAARMVAPAEQVLRIATPAYTAGTRGVQRGLAVIGPATLEEAQARASQFKDKWVLIGGLSNGSGRDGEYRHQPRAIMLALAQAGALGTIQAADEPLYSGAAAPTSWDALPSLPDIKLAESQYADIRKRLAAAEAVSLEFDIRNWFFPGPVLYHNVVARIPGTEKPDEIVLLGAHLDSFDGAGGAADNGAGVATMLEAMRLLTAAGAKPRRTIMMVAFAAEENGLKGASAFAEKHAAQLPGVVMMLNRDARPGAISSLTIPSAWKSVFARVEQDLRGVHPTFAFEASIDDRPRARIPGRSGSDDTILSTRGIPTPRFSALTDFDYEQVHHTVADTYDKVLPFRSAQQYSAITIATIAYEVANAREPISRADYYRDDAP